MKLLKTLFITLSLLAAQASYATQDCSQFGDQLSDQNPSATPAPTVVLNSLSVTDQYAKHLVSRLHCENVKKIEVYHVGKKSPEELIALIRLVTASGIRVDFKQTQIEEVEEILQKQTEKIAPTLSELALQIEYAADQSQHPETAKFRNTTSFKSELNSWVKHFFGVPHGISFMSYAKPRPLSQKAVEASVTATNVIVTSFVMVYALSAKQAMGEQVNIVLPVVVSAAFNLFFGYYQRGNSEFKGQGIEFDLENNQTMMNRKFFLLTSLIHSVIVREAIMAAAHVTSEGFTMGWDDALAAFSTSVKGLLGKSPIEMLIYRKSQTKSQWWTIGWMTAWGTFYASLQVLDMFQTGGAAKDLLFYFGSAGLVFEAYRYRSSVMQDIESIYNRLVPRWAKRKPASCKTILSPLRENDGSE